MRALVLAVLCPLTVACMPAYRYEGRPLPPAPRDAAERCYQEGRVELVSGDARWSESRGTPTYGFFGPGIAVTNTTFTRSGVAFYRGGERIDAVKAVPMLGDPELARAYDDRLRETAGDARGYPLWRNVSLGMAFGGLGLTLVGLGQTLANPGGTTMASLGPTLWLGTGIALLSAIPAVLAAGTWDGAVRHDRARHLFGEATLAARLDGAVRGHNRAVAKQCGAAADPDLPISPTLAGGVGAGAAGR